MQKRGIWTVVPVSECLGLGKSPVSVRWVDTDKGIDKPDLRSRLVARDFNTGEKGRDDLFAETPPLEAKRYLLSRAASIPQGLRGTRKLMFIDAKKAHLNPPCEEWVYVELPSETGCGSDKCGRLNFWLYGMRGAAAA